MTLSFRCKNSSTGRLDLLQLKKMVTENSSYAGMNKVFDESMQGDTESERLFGRNFFGGELQLNLRAGDVVVMHSDMAHGGAPNWSDAIREMVYFRIKHSHGTDFKMIVYYFFKLFVFVYFQVINATILQTGTK